MRSNSAPGRDAGTPSDSRRGARRLRGVLPFLCGGERIRGRGGRARIRKARRAASVLRSRVGHSERLLTLEAGGCRLARDDSRRPAREAAPWARTANDAGSGATRARARPHTLATQRPLRECCRSSLLREAGHGSGLRECVARARRRHRQTISRDSGRRHERSCRRTIRRAGAFRRCRRVASARTRRGRRGARERATRGRRCGSPPSPQNGGRDAGHRVINRH